MSALAELASQVRSILKAASEKPKEEKEKKAAVPVDPGDPDELTPDYRVGDASPTEKDAKDAKEDAGEDAEGKDSSLETADGGPEGEEPENQVGDEGEQDGPAPGEDQGEDNEDKETGPREIGKGFDEFGNQDLTDEQVRSILKGYAEAPEYGPETNPIPVSQVLDEGPDLKVVLDDVMKLIIHQQEQLENYSAVMDDLRAEIARMKRGMEKNDRSLTKALEVLGDPRTAVAAVPRGFSKAMPEAPAVPSVPTASGEALANQLFTDLRAGKITTEQAMAQCRAARSN